MPKPKSKGLIPRNSFIDAMHSVAYKAAALSPQAQAALVDAAIVADDDTLVATVARRDDLTPEVDASIASLESAPALAAWLSRPGRTHAEVMSRLKSEKRITVFATLATLKGQDPVVYQAAARFENLKIAWNLLENDDAACVHETALGVLVRTAERTSLSIGRTRDFKDLLRAHARYGDQIVLNTHDLSLQLIALDSGVISLKSAERIAYAARAKLDSECRQAAGFAARSRDLFRSHTMENLAITMAKVIQLFPDAEYVSELLDATEAALVFLDKSVEKNAMYPSHLKTLTSVRDAVAKAASNSGGVIRDIAAASNADELLAAWLKVDQDDKILTKIAGLAIVRHEHVTTKVCAAVLPFATASTHGVNLRALLFDLAKRYAGNDDALVPFVLSGLNDDDALEALASDPGALWRLVTARDISSVAANNLPSRFQSRFADASVIPDLWGAALPLAEENEFVASSVATYLSNSLLSKDAWAVFAAVFHTHCALKDLVALSNHIAEVLPENSMERSVFASLFVPSQEARWPSYKKDDDFKQVGASHVLDTWQLADETRRLVVLHKDDARFFETLKMLADPKKDGRVILDTAEKLYKLEKKGSGQKGQD